MKLESNDLNKYLEESKTIDFKNYEILELSKEIFKGIKNDVEKIEKGFLYVRDKINHSGDINSSRVTKTASEVLKYKEGICYAKSMLLAALLRSQNIPVGFCYQKLTLKDTPTSGYCIHALNAVYIKNIDRWIRIDARGNTNGINAQFNLEKEELAFPIRQDYSEVDYPIIYYKHLDKIEKVLEKNNNCREMLKDNLPIEI